MKLRSSRGPSISFRAASLASMVATCLAMVFCGGCDQQENAVSAPSELPEAFDPAMTLEFLTSANQTHDATTFPVAVTVLRDGVPLEILGLFRIKPQYDGEDDARFVDMARHVSKTHVSERLFAADSVTPEEYWSDMLGILEAVRTGEAADVASIAQAPGDATLVVDVAADGRTTFGFEGVSAGRFGIPSGYSKLDKAHNAVECGRWAIESDTEDPAPMIRQGRVPDRTPGTLEVLFDQFSTGWVAGRMTLRTDPGSRLAAYSYGDGHLTLRAIKYPSTTARDESAAR